MIKLLVNDIKHFHAITFPENNSECHMQTSYECHAVKK